MTLQSVDIEVLDNQLGVSGAATGDATLKIGVATGISSPAVYGPFADLSSLTTRFPSGGPVIEGAADTIVRAKRPVYICTINPSVAGSVGTVSRSGGSSGPVVTVSGPPNDGYALGTRIVQGGTLGTGTFQYTLDGLSWSAEITTAATYAITGTGLTLAFPSGTYVAGEAYAWPCTAPGYTLTDVQAAFVAILASSVTWKLAHLIGSPSSGNDAAKITALFALAAGVDTLMQAAQTANRYARIVLEAPVVSETALATAADAFVSTLGLVQIAARTCTLTSPISGRAYVRSTAWPYTTRVAKNAISQDPSATEDGPLDGVTAIQGDERTSPGLDAARFVTLRTYVGVSAITKGIWVTDCPTFALSTSDYHSITNAMVVDAACTALYEGLFRYQSKKISVNASTGKILEAQARDIESVVGAEVRAATVQPGDAIAASISVNRTDNILSSEELRADTRVVPFGYAKAIVATVALQNPALLLAA